MTRTADYLFASKEPHVRAQGRKIQVKQYIPVLFLFIFGILLSGCAPGQFLGPTITPSPTVTSTSTPTLTPVPTVTPTPTFTPTPTPQVFNITVPANTLWFNTGVNISKGQRVNITAEGIVNTLNGRKGSDSDANGQTQWQPCNDSACPIAEAYYGELVGRLGILPPFRVGKSFEMKALTKGVLILSVNDSKVEDNRGEFTVTITIQ